MTADGGPADLVVLGPVHRVDAAGSRTDALAVRGDRIVALGSADVRPLVGPRTDVVDATAGLVLPGFVDAHVHPATAGRNTLTADLAGLDGPEAYLAAVARYADAHPDRPWITGGGWSMEHFPGGLPRREDLDRVTGDRPAFLFNRDVHGAWVNTAALRAAGITAATPDPVDGRIERDPDGEPTGMLHEGAAYSLETDVLPAPGHREWCAAVLAGQAHLHRLGITGFQDAWVTPDLERAYRSVDADGALTARVVGALWWDRHRGLDQVDDLLDRRAAGPGRPGGAFHPGTVKIMIDGVLENGTGALLAPYCGHHHGPDGAAAAAGAAAGTGGTDGGDGANSGLVYVDPAVLQEAVTRLHGHGFQVHLHAIGDRAVRLALDAVAAARRRHGPGDHRHHVAHVQVVDPADLPRFRDLGVTATLQAFWAQHEPQMDELTVPFLGPRRSALQYPFRSLAASGATLAMGSDWGVTTADPLAQLEVAVTRRGPDRRDGPSFLPAERLSLPTAVRAFTAGSAWVNHDDDAGTLSVGRRADLAVLDRDVFADPDARVADARVTCTVAAGRVVHRDGR
ncbi:amidohydrolase [Nakamurella endophytica]|uniref:Amidohydrolase n=1 Tax=Nakamurella endophytica TaxID=1748367 RepID=A0A917SXN8_9ACTN|nr:amidohydrolase [Nakamurella endophytica]GGM02996.1 amidohydrolase [Nakamurella endophytica]